jgi:5'-deoxynucleotidase
VLEHTAFVAIYAMYLQRKHGGDLGKILTKALVHDMEETITGDIPNPTKYASVNIKHELDMMSRAAMHNICNEFFDKEIYDQWDLSKSDTTEGNIVAISDAAASVYKIQQEVLTGNRSLMKFIPNVRKGLEKLKSNLIIELKLEVDLLTVTLDNIGRKNEDVTKLC